MIKLFSTFLCILLFLPPLIFAEEPVLARDDFQQYTLSNLKIFMRLKNYSSLETIIPKIIEMQDAGRKFIVENSLKDLAFQTELVTEDIQNGTIDPRIDFFVREKLRKNVLEENVNKLNKECRVTSEELELAYKARREEFKTGERRKVSVLYKVFPDNRELRQSLIRTLERIREKPDFNEKFFDYVKEYSDLPGALNGGVVDYFTRGTYGPIFEKYAFQTPKGEISPVFTATKGAYIIKCLDIIPSGYRSLKKVEKTLKEPIFEKKFSQARESLKKRIKENNKIEIIEALPKSGPSDLVLLKVNDYILSSGTLFSTYPELVKDPSPVLPYLSKTAEKESMVQQWEREAEKNPSSLKSGELEILKIITYFDYLLARIEYQSFDVTEEEMRDYYNEKKGAYHEVTPKRLSYLLIRFPDDKSISEPEFYKKLEWLQRDIFAFREKILKNPDSFLAEANKMAESRKDATLLESEWIQAFPQDWKASKPIIEFNVGSISSVVPSSKGLLVFKVIDKKDPPLLAYEDVKQKVYGVLFSKKRKDFYEELQKETLERNHFQLLLAF